MPLQGPALEKARGRVGKLAEQGVPPEQIAKVKTPIGLNLGSDRAEVIALGILAEMVQVKYRGTGRPMAEKLLQQAGAASKCQS